MLAEPVCDPILALRLLKRGQHPGSRSVRQATRTASIAASCIREPRLAQRARRLLGVFQAIVQHAAHRSIAEPGVQFVGEPGDSGRARSSFRRADRST